MADGDGSDRRSMAAISHENPYTGSTLGGVFRRGPAVPDGGTDGSGRGDVDEAEAGETGADETRGTSSGASSSSSRASPTETATVSDVDHTPRNGNVNDVWVRGGRSSGVSDGSRDVSDEPGDER